MDNSYSPLVEIAREYYNSSDADNFYYYVWGGNDIHIGMYESEDEAIADASHRTVLTLARQLPHLTDGSTVLDIGAGYGGAARYLAAVHGCRVAALNLSEKENERHRRLNEEAGLDHLIDVIDGSFEEIPFDDESIHVVWSQDAILHSEMRGKVIEEVARVLVPGGTFIFTDPMQADNCPAGVLRPVLERIHLQSLGSPSYYINTCRDRGLKLVMFTDYTEHLGQHYRRVCAELHARKAELGKKISSEYIKHMLKGLRNWVNACNKQYLCWGIFQFKKVS